MDTAPTTSQPPHALLDPTRAPADDADAEQQPSPQSRSRRTALRRDSHKVTRWLHTYLSMISLALILFFGLTGITLNHPDWTLGLSGSQQTYSGTLPAIVENQGTVDHLAVAQYLEATHGVRGDVSDYSADATQGSMSFKGPGYAADLFFDPATRTYDLTVDQQGLLAVANDLHKGRNTGGAWNWTIDIAAGFLVAVSLTGLGLQFFLTRRRTRAYVVAVAGVLASVILFLVTVK